METKTVAELEREALERQITKERIFLALREKNALARRESQEGVDGSESEIPTDGSPDNDATDSFMDMGAQG